MVLLLKDTFTRTSTTTLGTTEASGTLLGAVAWVPQVGTWGTTGTAAYNPSGSPSAVATVELGRSNFDLRITLGSSGGSSYFGVIFRYSDINNYIYVNKTSGGLLQCVKVVAGVSTTIFSFGSAYSGGSDVRITCINNVITVYMNGSSSGLSRAIEPFNRSATKIGLLVNSNSAYQMDNLEVYDVTVPTELSIDSFNRVDNAVLGNTDGTGILDFIAWQADGGPSFLSGISGNKASYTGGATVTFNPPGFTSLPVEINFINAGTPNVQIYIFVVSAGSSTIGIIFRYVDDNNYWLAFADPLNSRMILFKKVAGTWTNVSGTISNTSLQGNIFNVKLSGSTIICETRGQILFTTADTDLQTATRHGFLVRNDGSAIDNFNMWAGDPAIPAITQIGPTQGSVAGGTDVTIVGNNFTGTTAVSFGAIPATSFTVISDSYINAVAPAHIAGLVDIVVTNAAGDNVFGVADQYTFVVPVPLVSSVTPNHGVLAGGFSVVITGAFFTGATSVKFGTTEATSFTVDSDGQITAVAPAHAAAMVPIIITTPAGSN